MSAAVATVLRVFSHATCSLRRSHSSTAGAVHLAEGKTVKIARAVAIEHELECSDAGLGVGDGAREDTAMDATQMREGAASPIAPARQPLTYGLPAARSPRGREAVMAKITLYGPPDIPFTRKVVAALALKGISHSLVEPQSPEDYKRWSPETGLLPVIDVEGRRVQDSGRILDFLDAEYPEPPLLSSDVKVATSQRRLEVWVEETLTFYWVNYLRSQVDGSEDAPYRPELGAEFPTRLDDLVNFLGGRPFFYADAPSRADLAVWSFLKGIGLATGPRVEREVEERTALRDHLERVNEIYLKARTVLEAAT